MVVAAEQQALTAAAERDRRAQPCARCGAADSSGLCSTCRTQAETEELLNRAARTWDVLGDDAARFSTWLNAGPALPAELALVAERLRQAPAEREGAIRAAGDDAVTFSRTLGHDPELRAGAAWNAAADACHQARTAALYVLQTRPDLLREAEDIRASALRSRPLDESADQRQAAAWRIALKAAGAAPIACWRTCSTRRRRPARPWRGGGSRSSSCPVRTAASNSPPRCRDCAPSRDPAPP
ncbi:hypothetical protein POF50_008625 [Streptomyces sp. SL13]|uniref:Uncharacterized protein n=1 Tax=Streptantibioticus silvisoli TaxID=2705255 RepID=A0AA90H367_9ACTN|nr:hypothetical protein [Streptantibioticus silvisoli]MDI5969407.1 hypothetical protein [Streptantibioticus silvisoli]